MVSLFVVLFFATLQNSIHGSVNFEKYTTDHLADFVKLDGKIEKNSNGISSLHVDLEFSKDLDFKPMLSTELFKKNKGKDTYNSVIQVPRISYCDAASGANPLASITIDQIKKYSNLPTQCPIKAGKYQIKNLVIPDAVFPPIIFSGGAYKEVIKFYDDAPEPKLLGIFTAYLLYEP